MKSVLMLYVKFWLCYYLNHPGLFIFGIILCAFGRHYYILASIVLLVHTSDDEQNPSVNGQWEEIEFFKSWVPT